MDSFEIGQNESTLEAFIDERKGQEEIAINAELSSDFAESIRQEPIQLSDKPKCNDCDQNNEKVRGFTC